MISLMMVGVINRGHLVFDEGMRDGFPVILHLASILLLVMSLVILMRSQLTLL